MAQPLHFVVSLHLFQTTVTYKELTMQNFMQNFTQSTNKHFYARLHKIQNNIIKTENNGAHTHAINYTKVTIVPARQMPQHSVAFACFKGIFLNQDLFKGRSQNW